MPSAGRKDLRNNLLLLSASVILTIALLEVFLRLAGLLYLKSHHHHPLLKVNTNAQVIRIVCVGESTTFSGDDFSYPSQLERLLNARDKSRRYEVINKGYPGLTSGRIVAQMSKILDDYSPDFVVAMMGINDREGAPVFGEKKTNRLSDFLHDLRVVKLLMLLKLHVMNCWEDFTNSVFHADYFPENSENYRIERKLKNEICLHPQGTWFYLKLEELYDKTGRHQAGEEILEKGIANNPAKQDVALALENFLKLNQNRTAEVEEVFEKIMQHDPRQIGAYIVIARYYEDKGNLEKAKAILEELLTNNPNAADAYRKLAEYYSRRKEYQEAEAILRKALELKIADNTVLIQLAFCYGEQGNDQMLEDVFDQAAQVYGPRILRRLVRWYAEKGRHEKAREITQKAIALSPHDRIFFETFLSQITSASAVNLNMNPPQEEGPQPLFNCGLARNPATEINYKKLVSVVRQRGVTLISMQYPRQNIAPLKGILGEEKGVIFVENKKNFEEALKHADYRRYFVDSFAGDFGHCTPAGNRLIAENLADTVIHALRISP